MLEASAPQPDHGLQWIAGVREQFERVIVGQQSLLDRLLAALITGNHVLIEGVPGLGKTLSILTLARSLDATFHRIQFTPDLLPSDIVGTLIYDARTSQFTPRKGPVFANIVLADEVNRAPAKVQSALLEAMQEHQVTIGDDTFPLPSPFLVLATQNPIEHEGTYPLPEAQLDRFLFKLVLDYPAIDEERLILDRMVRSEPDIAVTAVASPADVLCSRRWLDDVHLEPRLRDYIVNVVDATRHPARYGLKIESLVRYGASPRASIFLAVAAKCVAMLEGRNFVLPQDVKDVAADVLRHRVLLSYEADAQGVTSDRIVEQVLGAVEVP
jgi:MoxR-like ATPase